MPVAKPDKTVKVDPEVSLEEKVKQDREAKISKRPEKNRD